MKRRRIKTIGLPSKEDLTRLGLQDADPEDPDTHRVLLLHELMGDPAAPRQSISSGGAVVTQGRSHKARLPDLGPIKKELTVLWKRWETSTSQEARRRIRREIHPLDQKYFWIVDHMPAEERPSPMAYCRVWHGRVYGVNPRGIDFLQALSILNQILPPGYECSEGEVRDRFVAYLWALRGNADFTVGIPVSRGKPKARCVDCGNVHFVSARTKDMKLVGCPKCGSRTHNPIDPTLTKPGSERRFRVTQAELCQRFRIPRGRLRTIIGRYVPRKAKLPKLRIAVTTEAPLTQ